MTKVSHPLEEGSSTVRQVRLLKIAIAVMTVLIIVGIAALIYGMARQASKLGTAKAVPTKTDQPAYFRSLDLGRGQIAGVSTADGLVILFWKGEAGDTILTVDPRDGRELGRIQVPHP